MSVFSDRVLRWFAPAIWLSGRLSFSRKYLLIGVVVLVALASLSMPLWQQVRQARHSADTERAGLRAFALQAEALAHMVQLRDQAVRGPAPDALPQASQALAALTPASTDSPDAAWTQLQQRWQQVQQLDASAPAQRRFAVLNGAINAMLGLLQASARTYRLNVDSELDATFELLTSRLPLVLDTLGKQQDALALNTGDMASYALGAQVVLSESMPGLKAGVAQLLEHHPQAQTLQTQLQALLVGIVAQQDAADKTLDDPQALDELRLLANDNQQRARALLQAVTRLADTHLQARISHLQYTQWKIGRAHV